MALESLTGTSVYIDDLVKTNPVGATDPKSQGDDHIRGVKNVLLNTFPSLTGAVTATQDELNILDGATLTTAELNILAGATVTTAELNILDGVTATATELNLLSGKTGTGAGAKLDAFATGTAMLFYQAAAPTGWTQDATKNDYMLRVVSTAGGGSGGSDSPTTSHTHTGPSHTHTTGDVTLTESQIPAHTHTISFVNASSGEFSGPGEISNRYNVESYPVTSNSTGGGGSHNHGATGASGTGSTSSNFSPKYVDTIICTKDA